MYGMGVYGMKGVRVTMESHACSAVSYSKQRATKDLAQTYKRGDPSHSPGHSACRRHARVPPSYTCSGG